MKSWKNRFFVLENGVMTYYESSTAKAPYGVGKKGDMSLRNCSLAVEKSIVRVSSPAAANEKGHTELVMDIKYPNERTEWVQSIKEHIEYYSDK